MSIFNNQKFIVKSSENKLYLFYLTKSSELKCDLYSKEGIPANIGILEKGIIDFSVGIDNKDLIHVVYLTIQGNLYYAAFTNNRWYKHELTMLNIKPNKFKNLILKVINTELHIFYEYNDFLNPNIWTIQHLSKNDIKWSKKNIISFNGKNAHNPFYIDFDRLGNIHLTYTSYNNEMQQIYYISYSSFLNKWNNSPQLISDNNMEISNHYLFVDTQNNVHIVWSTINSKNKHQIFYKLLPYTQSNTFKWKKVNIPSLNSIDVIDNILMYEENNLIKLLVKTGNNVKVFSSIDYGYTWKIDKEINLKNTENISIIKYGYNNSVKGPKNKINHVLGKIDGEIFIYYTNSIININKRNMKFEDKSPFSNLEENLSIDLSNVYVRDFFSSVQNEINELSNNIVNIQILKNEIEEIIYNNALKLNKKILNNNKEKEAILKEITRLSNKIYESKNEMNNLLKLLHSVKEKLENNINELDVLMTKMKNIEDILVDSQNNSIFKKIINIFKSGD